MSKTDIAKGVRKLFPCPFCASTHTSKTQIKYCDKNPDAEENRRIKSENYRRAYYRDNIKDRLSKATNNEVTKIKRSNYTKKMWEDGRLGNTAGEKNGMHGKKHSLESRIKTSRSVSASWYATRGEKMVEYQNIAVERANLVAPILDMSHDFFRGRVDKEGFSTEEFTNSSWFDDEFDPFH